MIWLDILFLIVNSMILINEDRKGYIIAFSFMNGVFLTLAIFKLVTLWLF